jgi:serine/threonine protein kinase
LSLVETLTLGIRLAEALSYMHACGGLHRDIKPGNIGLTASGAPKLLDFGLATDHGAFAGTPAYLPPEALDGALPDAAVDLWGLSVVLLEACGGRGRMPAALAPFFNRALAPGEETRFQSADEWRAALEGVAAVLESAAGEPIPTISS